MSLVSDIFPKNFTATKQSRDIVGSFAEEGNLNEGWSEKTSKIITNDPELPQLLAEILQKYNLCVSCLLGTTMSTDNCSVANSMQQKMTKLIYNVAWKKNLATPDELLIHFGNCHKAMSGHMCKRLTTDLKSDLESFPPHL